MRKTILWGTVTLIVMVLLAYGVYAGYVNRCSKHPIWMGNSANSEWTAFLSDKGNLTGIYDGYLYHNKSFKLSKTNVKITFIRDGRSLTNIIHYQPNHWINFIDSELGLQTANQKVIVLIYYKNKTKRIKLHQLTTYWPWEFNLK